MTKIILDTAVKKETVKNREKKNDNSDRVQEKTLLQEEVNTAGGSIDAKAQVVVSEKLQVQDALKEKSKREKNIMPKKTAKKEQEVLVHQETQQSVAQPSVPSETVVRKEEKLAVQRTDSVVHAPVAADQAASLGNATEHRDSQVQTVSQSSSSDATQNKQKPYSPHQQQQQYQYQSQSQYQQSGKKFIKKPHKSAHPQSSHYQQQGNQNDRYDNRQMDGTHKSKEDILKQPLTREQLEEMSLQDLYVHAKRHGVIGAVLMSHKNLVEKIIEMQQDPEREILIEGVLEKLPDGFGFLRSPRFDYVSSPDDIYVSPAQIRKMGLRTGDTISGTIRRPKDNEKYFALARIDRVNFSDPAKLHERPHFDRLSPTHPNKKFTLEYLPHYVSTRIMDIFTPIGKGQRGLIVAPPKAGKTVLSKEIAQSLIANHPEIYLIMLLIDERPEEVADMKRFVKGAHAEVISSTFDEPAERHVQVAEAVLEKAKRLVEVGKDVVIFLDSVTRLARAYNTVAPASGKILTGGVDANSLQRPKRFFGAARCLEEGGSLTILGSALIETGSRMDEVIYEEFKGTGNMEIHMSRKLSNRRIYPAFDLLVSGTRRDELLQAEEELNRSWVLQKFLANMNTAEAMEFLLDKMKKFKTNEEFFESMNPKKYSNGNGSNGNGK